MEHPVIGEKNLRRRSGRFGQSCPIIRHHHERLNGTGYPDGLKNGSIPLTGSDRVDRGCVRCPKRLTSPYRRASPAETSS